MKMKSVRERITGKKHSNRVLLSLHDTLDHLLHTKMWLKVLIALVMGSVIGILLGPDMNLFSSSLSATITDWVALPGHLFLSIIKMIIIPLVFSSIIIGIVSSGNSSFLKKIGPRIGLYFLITTTVAIGIGFAITSIVQPGSYIDPNSFSSLSSEPDVNMNAGGIQDMSTPEKIVNIIPSNPFRSILNGDLLGVVILSMIVGIAMFSLKKEQFHTTVTLLESVQEITMRIIKWVMYIVPLAVLGLIAQVTSKIGLDALAGLGIYVLTVLGGLLALMIFYNLVVLIFTSTSPREFMKQIREAQLLAFSTSSSAAVMPISMKIGEE